MKELVFEEGDKWRYDPHRVVSNRRMEITYAPYIHEAKTKLENMANQEVEEKQQKMDVESPMPKKISLKRNSPKQMYIDMESFQLQKKTKV